MRGRGALFFAIVVSVVSVVSVVACRKEPLGSRDSGAAEKNGTPAALVGVDAAPDHDWLVCASHPRIEPVAAAIAQGRLWVVSREGLLYSFNLLLDDLREHSIVRDHGWAANIVAVRRGKDGSLLALEHRGDVGSIHRIVGELRTEILSFPMSARRELGDVHKTFIEVGSHFVVVNGHELTVLDAKGDVLQTRVRPEMLPHGATLSITPGHNDDFFVGVWKGEWGGGVVRAHFEADAELVLGRPYWDGGNLTPVTAVHIDPTEKGCVYASLGLMHIGVHPGRVERICNGRVRTIFQQQDVAVPPIWDIAVRGDVVLALGDEIYRITKPSSQAPTVQRLKLPRAKRHCGLSVIELDDFWLLPQAPNFHANHLAIPKPD